MSGDTWAAEGTQDHQILICKSVRMAAILTLENYIISAHKTSWAAGQRQYGDGLWSLNLKIQKQYVCLGIPGWLRLHRTTKF